MILLKQALLTTAFTLLCVHFTTTFFISSVFQQSSKKYFEEFCGSLESPEVEFMRRVFNDRSVLFLGCDPNREEFKGIFEKFAVSAKVQYIERSQMILTTF